MNEDLRAEVRRAVYEVVGAAPPAHPFDELAERAAPDVPAPSRWLLAATATVAALLVGAVLVATRTDPGGRGATSPATTVESEPSVSEPATQPSAPNAPIPSDPAPTPAPGTASPSTTAPRVALPRLAVTEPGATLLFGSIFRDSKATGGCCYQQVFRRSDDRTWPPAVWLYDGENNLADNFVGADVRAVTVGAVSGQIRERARGDQTFVELLFRPAPGRRALLLSLGLTRPEVLAMAASLVPRAGDGYDWGSLPVGLVPTIEGPLGNLWADEQTQVAYALAGGGTVGITQFDSGREMLEETIASALLADATVAMRTVDGRGAIALTTTSTEGRRVRFLFPEAHGWVDLALRNVPEDREAAVLASIRTIPAAAYEAALRSLPPTTVGPRGAPSATMP